MFVDERPQFMFVSDRLANKTQSLEVGICFLQLSSHVFVIKQSDDTQMTLKYKIISLLFCIWIKSYRFIFFLPEPSAMSRAVDPNQFVAWIFAPFFKSIFSIFSSSERNIHAISLLELNWVKPDKLTRPCCQPKRIPANLHFCGVNITSMFY